jgi:hypothetical protein
VLPDSLESDAIHLKSRVESEFTFSICVIPKQKHFDAVTHHSPVASGHVARVTRAVNLGSAELHLTTIPEC